MIDAMTVRNLSQRTQDLYVWSVAQFARSFGHRLRTWVPPTSPPTTLSCSSEAGLVEHIECRRVRAAVSVQRNAWQGVGDRAHRICEEGEALPEVPASRKLSISLQAFRTLSAVLLLVTATRPVCGCRKWHVCVDRHRQQAYGIGLCRAKDEKIATLCSHQASFAVARILEGCRPKREWLFPGASPKQHITAGTINEAAQSWEASGLKKKVTCECCATSFATHLLEGGTNNPHHPAPSWPP